MEEARSDQHEKNFCQSGCASSGLRHADFPGLGHAGAERNLGGDANGQPLASVEIYSGGSFASATTMHLARRGHSATLLPDGRVLVTGGETLGEGPTNATEIYDPVNDSWSFAGALAEPRSGHTATSLWDGSVVIAGGWNAQGALASVEIFDLATESFSYAGALSSARSGHAAAAVGDTVLFIGGWDGAAALSSAEIYDAWTGEISAGPALNRARRGHSATVLLDGRVLVTGGWDGAEDSASAEIYDPATNSWSDAGSLAAPRSGHSAFLLPNNNNVLIVGGSAEGAELYTPWTAGFSATGSPVEPRNGAAGGAVGDGLLLLAGGGGSASAELYGFHTVRTDHDDYKPGETVTITGSGWEPGETVTLLLQEVPMTHDDRTLTAVADDDGNIYNDEFAPEAHDLGVLFYLTASGEASGRSAQTRFTDADPDLTSNKEALSGTSGSAPLPGNSIGLGGTFRWRVRAVGGGASASFSNGQVILRDELPIGPTYGAVTVSENVTGNVACSISVSVLTCTASGAVTMQPGGTVAATFPVTPNAAGTLTNPRAGGICRADPDNHIAESNEGNNDCTHTVTVVAPDLTAEKVNLTTSNNPLPNDEIVLGGTFRWRIRLMGAGAGTGAATFTNGQVILQDELPIGPSYSLVAVSTNNVSGSVACSIVSSVLTCTATGTVTIQGNGTIAVTFNVTPNAAGTLTNPRASGICRADPNDVVDESNDSNNDCTASVDVLAPDLTATKTNNAGSITGTADTTFVGVTFQWNIHVENEGTSNATFNTGLMFTDNLPSSGATYSNVMVTTSAGVSGTINCAIASNNLTCNVGTGPVVIPPGESFDVKFDVTPTAVGTLVNPRASGICRIDSNVPDKVLEGNENNNDCSDTVTVLANNAVTSSALCTFDVDTNVSGDQFRLIFTPDQLTGTWKLRASNPGQFFYNVFHYSASAETVDITLPYPFVTQGATPIHIFSSVTVTTNGATCYTPGTETGSQMTQITLASYSPQTFGSTTTVTVSVPAGFSYINLHLDYGLKGATGYTPNMKITNPNALNSNSALGPINNNDPYTFSFMDGNSGSATVRNQNVFKNDPGIGGLVTSSGTGDPVAGVKVEIYDGKGKKLATVYSDVDGWYMWGYKYTGKPATFTVKLPDYNLSQTVTLKSNGYLVVDFVVP